MPRTRKTNAPQKASGSATPRIMGWREYIRLPALGLGPIVAKVDTGARTAALHALNIEALADGDRVRFDAVVDETQQLTRVCSLPLHGVKRVKNPGGAVEDRYVIETEIAVGPFRWTSLFTLTDRADMGVPILIGRSTIRGRFLVNPSRSFLLGEPASRPQPARGKRAE